MSLPKSISYTLPETVVENRVSWSIDPSSAALLVHDMQHYFVNAYDKAADPIKTVIENIKKLTFSARKAGIPVFYSAQKGNQPSDERALLTDFWGKGLPEDPTQTDILIELAPEDGDIRLSKWRYSAFKKSNFHELLVERQRTQLIIVGIYGHIGCLSTALEAFMLDIKPFIPKDAIADFSREEHEMALSYIAKRCGVITDTAELLATMNDKKSIPQTMDEVKNLLGGFVNMAAIDIEDDVYIPDLGLDSIRLLQLAEQWQSHGVSYLSLMQNPTPKGWLNLLLAR